MKKLRWQLLVVTLALGAIGILLLGQQPAAVPGLVPVIAPKTGGIYTEALVGSFGRLNPLLDYFNSADHDINRVLYSGLVRFDDRGNPVGDLAETWGISQDGTVYNFSIRSNAVWHDGKPVISDDLVFTVELMRDEQIPLPEDLREFWQEVEIKPLDEKTLQFRLPEPFAPFMDYLTFGILPSHLLSGMSAEELIDASFNLMPVGSGPYKFDRLIVEEGEITGVILAVFDEYYGTPPYVEQLVFRYYPESAAALEAYRQGEVMGISQIAPEVLPQALKEPNLRLYTGRLPRLTMLYMNLDNSKLPVFKDATLRRALLTGLNRQWMVDHLLQGQAVVSHGPILPETWAYYDGVERINYDPEAAIAILKKAGYTYPAEGGEVRSKDGVALSFEMVYPDTPVFAQVAAQVQKDWQRLGVGLELKAVPYDDLVSEYLETQDYQVALVELNLARSPDPDPYPFWHQAQINNGQNYAGWDDRQASEYLEQARVQVDNAERIRRYRNFQVRFASELPALPLFYPVYTYGVDATMQRVQMGPLFDPSDRFSTITSWFLVSQVANSAAEAETGITPTP